MLTVYKEDSEHIENTKKHIVRAAEEILVMEISCCHSFAFAEE